MAQLTILRAREQTLKQKLTQETEALQAYKDTSKEAMQTKQEEKKALEEAITNKTQTKLRILNDLAKEKAEIEKQRQDAHISRKNLLESQIKELKEKLDKIKTDNRKNEQAIKEKFFG